MRKVRRALQLNEVGLAFRATPHKEEPERAKPHVLDKLNNYIEENRRAVAE